MVSCQLLVVSCWRRCFHERLTPDYGQLTTNKMTSARIIGTGSYVPEKVLTNDDLSHMLGEDINEFVSQVIGINERHVCAEDESTADLAEAASLKALESAGITPDQLDLIILATDTPEHAA